MRATGIIALVLFAILTAKSTTAQSIDGFQPFGTFSNAGPETINMGNLNAHWAIPVITRNGRIPFSFAINYDSTVYARVNNTYTWDFEPINFGWQQSLEPVFGELSFSEIPQSCVDTHQVEWDWDDYVFTGYVDRLGTSHPINFTISDVSYQNPPCNRSDQNPTSGSATSADDAAYTIAASVNSQSQLAATVTSPDGDVIIPPRDNGSLDFGTPKWADRNGNLITASVTFQSGHQITTFTDTLGSIVLTEDINPNPPQHTYTYPQPGGGTASIIFNFSPYTVQTNFNCTSIAVADFGPWSENLVSSIQLPDGSTYGFTYESTPGYPGNFTGRVASITLPSGGSVNYQYTGPNNGASCTDATIMGYNRVTQDGTTSYSRNGGITTVSDQQGNTAQYTFNSQYYETQRQYSNGAGTLQTVTKTYNGGTFSLPINRITTAAMLPSGLQNKTDTFINANGLTTEIDSYDWGSGGPGTLLRKDVTSYASLGNNILDKPYQATITDGAGNTKAQSTYTYDQGAPTASGATQLQPVIGSRGNATTIASWVQGTATVNRTVTYWDTGLVKTASDFNLNSTSYTYGNCNAAFPTVVSLPGGLTESMTWDCNGGVKTSDTDVNNQQTTYVYGDPHFWRLTQTNYPDGGQVTATFSTVSAPWNVVNTVKINATQSASTKTVFDGLGRLQQKQVTSDPDGIVYADTSYDIDGNVHSVSNPYRSTSDSTYGTTSFAYDVLGRMTQQTTQPDNNTFAVAPSSNCETMTDQAQKQKEVCVDGLGRVSTVYEPDNGNALTWETDYAYDSPTPNTATITQKGGAASGQWRVRTFTYDGLQRMVQEITPESGTTNIYYTTSAGALCSGEPNLPCRRADGRDVTTTYSYDVLNRLIGKTYSDGTAAVSYFYDQTSYNGLTISNGKGRRTGMSDGSGQTAWSYDAAGRVLAKRQTIAPVGSGLATMTNNISYTYNLDGSVNTITYPSGRVITYGYNNSQQAVSLVDNNTSIYRNFVTNAHYNALGALTSATHGDGITDSNSFNSRLEPTLLSTASRSQTLISYTYSYDQGGGQNNGRVVQMINNLTGTRNPSNNRSLAFTYDQLNRLKTSGTMAGVGTPWTTTYAYDPWGNLYQKTTSGPGDPNIGPLSVDTHNRVNSGSYTYDGAGNLTFDGHNALNFDAENQIHPVSGLQYYYDGDGHRVAKSNGARYWYDDGFNVISDADSSNTVKHDFIFFNDARIAYVSVSSGDSHYYLADHIGSPHVIANGDGSVVSWEADYFPYGGEIPISNADNLSLLYLFTGYAYDSETGDYYADFREQSPALGRFFQGDPYDGSMSTGDPQSLNRYAYVGNDPINAIDPLGLQAGMGCAGDPGIPCGSARMFGGCQIDGGSVPCQLAGSSESYEVCPSFGCEGYGVLWDVVDGHYMVNLGSTTSRHNANGEFTLVDEVRWKDMGLQLRYTSPQIMYGDVAIGGVGELAEEILAMAERGISRGLLEEAASQYPKLADILHDHHVIPRYLGGDLGPVRRIPAAYHQLITNAIRKLAPYGRSAALTGQEIKNILIEVYTQYPLP